MNVVFVLEISQASNNSRLNSASENFQDEHDVNRTHLVIVKRVHNVDM